MPPPLSSPHLLGTVKKACSEVSSRLSADFRALLGIRQATASSTTHLLDLSDDSSYAAHFSLTQHFERQLDVTKADHLSCWTPTLEVELQGAKLYLYATTLALPAAGSAKDASAQSLHQEIALQKGLSAAMTLIMNTTTLNCTPSDSHYDLTGATAFYPKQYFTTLFFAAAFLFRFLSSSRAATQQDRGLAVTALMDAHKIFQSFHKHRDHVRAALHIETFVEILRFEYTAARRSSSSTDLVVTSRLGASVMWDAVFCAARYRNRQLANGQSGAPYTWRTLNDDSADRLPLAPKDKDAGGSPGSMFDVEDTSWLEPWNAYVTKFGVDVEQLDALDLSLLPGVETGWDLGAMHSIVDQEMQQR